MNCYDVTYRLSPQGVAPSYGDGSPPLKKWKAMINSASSNLSDDVMSTSDVKRKIPLSVAKSDQPVSTLRISSRCVLLTYFDGDVTSCIDEHFSRALRQPNLALAGVGDELHTRQSFGQQHYSSSLINADRAPCSMRSQRHQTSDSNRTYQTTPTTPNVDWSNLMTSSFGSVMAPSADGSCYCAPGSAQMTDPANDSSSWAPSLRFRPHYAWPDPTGPTTAPRSGSTYSHHRHADMTSPFSIASAAPPTAPYVDYQSLFASSRNYRHTPAASSGSATFPGRSGVCEDIATESLAATTGDVTTASDLNWSSFGLGSGHHVTAMSPTVRQCHAQRNDVNDQRLVSGHSGDCDLQTKTHASATKDFYWF